jgi:hypothetical protein
MTAAPIICTAALTSALRPFSGFGLGSLLLPAVAGAFVASRLVSQITCGAVRIPVSILLALIALGLAAGLV